MTPTQTISRMQLKPRILTNPTLCYSFYIIPKRTNSSLNGSWPKPKLHQRSNKKQSKHEYLDPNRMNGADKSRRKRCSAAPIHRGRRAAWMFFLLA
nr:hypothetical protein Iba_chr06aCG4550 [Ipomoea batatas]GMD06870.1 hypothetical protein Iba_chr06cCG1720 [Ipomoea batatas]